MTVPRRPDVRIDAGLLTFYRDVMTALGEAGVEYLVGGAYALEHYTGIARDTKDLDLFVRHEDRHRALHVLAAAGHQTELTFPHWLGKAYHHHALVDIIFGSGNGVAVVDDGWFAHAVPASIFRLPVRLCPIEETIWSKAFIMERERFDGADVLHLIHARAECIDWDRLLQRFGPHWRVLFSHLILFGFVYPGEHRRVPATVMRALGRRLRAERRSPQLGARVCHGPLLSRAQYLHDLVEAGYEDARQAPHGPLGREDVARWTAAIVADRSSPRAA
jgi:hypothetical protein